MTRFASLSPLHPPQAGPAPQEMGVKLLHFGCAERAAMASGITAALDEKQQRIGDVGTRDSCDRRSASAR